MRRINKDSSEKTLDKNLELIAKSALMSGFIIDAIFGIMKEKVGHSKVVRNKMLLDPEWPEEMRVRVTENCLNTSSKFLWPDVIPYISSFFIQSFSLLSESIYFFRISSSSLLFSSLLFSALRGYNAAESSC